MEDVMKKFNTQHDYTPPTGEIMDPENKVEQGGYLKTKDQCDRMFLAGKRLTSFKQGYYDYAPTDEIPEDVQPVLVRNPEFDMADLTQMQLELKKRMLQQLREKAGSQKVKEEQIKIDKDLKKVEKPTDKEEAE